MRKFSTLKREKGPTTDTITQIGSGKCGMLGIPGKKILRVLIYLVHSKGMCDWLGNVCFWCLKEKHITLQSLKLMSIPWRTCFMAWKTICPYENESEVVLNTSPWDSGPLKWNVTVKMILFEEQCFSRTKQVKQRQRNLRGNVSLFSGLL